MPDKKSRKDKKYSKQLDRIENRSEKGFRNYKHAGRNLDRAVKAEEHFQNKDNRQQGGRAGDVADKVFNQFKELSPFQYAASDKKQYQEQDAPFYKTGNINYNKK